MLGSKFQWGVDLDDMWRYAGIGTPRSIVIPFVFSVKSQTDRFSLSSHFESRKMGANLKQEKQSRVWGEVPPQESRDQVTLRRAIDLASLLKKSNIGFVRCWFPWNFFEKKLPTSYTKNGNLGHEYYFPLDNFVSKLHEADIEIIGVIGAGYSRFLPSNLDTKNLEDYTARLAESSAQIVRHYRHKVKTWQIENEPNWWRAHYSMRWRRGQIWHGTRNQQGILGALHKVVRSESPSSTIIVNLEADVRFRRMTNWKFYSKFCDVIGLDYYPGYIHPHFVDTAGLCETASMVRKETGLKVLIMETGYPSGPRILGYTEDRQTAYVHLAAPKIYSCDSISGLGWFRFSDSYWKSFPFHENYFGLLSQRGRQKPAWREYIQKVSDAKGRPTPTFELFHGAIEKS